MKLFSFLFFFLFFMVSSSVRADHTKGSFCSMAARDGLWAFSFLDTSIEHNCYRARQILQMNTLAPIHAQNLGDYSKRAWNEVTARCYPFVYSFYGVGVEPLQRAYLTLRNTAQDCVFFVRH